MLNYTAMDRATLLETKQQLLDAYHAFQSRNVKLDMSRGKPGADQLDLSMGMLSVLTEQDMKTVDGIDVRNYGVLDGISEAKQLFAELLEVKPSQVIVGGNSSLNMMYDTIARAMCFGILGSTPWSKLETIKFLCPVPGYDRHFSICEIFGIEMITVPMTPDGPDMDLVEQLVSQDDAIKGIWCVPMYSNPDGITYSDQVVRRFANLKPKAQDFRIFWDNAYCVHHLTAQHDTLRNIITECEQAGNPNLVFEFASTSKISFSGAGVAVMVASEENLASIKKQLSMQTIGSDKINQLRHVKFFKNAQGVHEHMKKHAALIAPKFQAVLDALQTEIAPLELASWTVPKGGYFVSVNVLDGCAKRVVALCKEAGVVLTGAGATYPYGNDPRDRNIRIAPTVPPVSELKTAMELFCLCVKLASVEVLLAQAER